MRPVAGAPPAPPPRKHSTDSGSAEASPTVAAGGQPTSFFMASESELEERDAEQQHEASVADSTYGVRSMDENMEDPAEPAAAVAPPRPQRRRTAVRTGAPSQGAEHEEHGLPSAVLSELWAMRRDASLDSLHRELSASSAGSTSSRDLLAQQQHRAWAGAEPGLSQPLTPVSFASPFLGSSVPSSPKSLSTRSFRHSDDDELESQAVASSDDEADPAAAQQQLASHQLIMPSITMPSRRPFTARGRGMGRLKVLVAGASGTGKTSLIKSIVQTCEDIVHVDALPVGTPKASAVRSSTRHRTSRVSEICASTRAYPSWWAECEADGSGRRGSTGDNILERNLCFVDTPGYDRGTSMLEGMQPTLQYVEAQFKKSLSDAAMSDAELLGLLDGSGGFHVDVALYLIDQALKPADIELIRQLNRMTNVIPLLAKADMLASDTVADLKSAAAATLSSASITPAALPPSTPDFPAAPFTVCALPSHELDAMDASVLMRSEYIPSLHHSDLPQLLSALFDPSTILYLKHTSARKLLASRLSSPSLPLPHPSSTSLIPSAVLPVQRSTASNSTLTAVPTSVALSQAGARLADHQAREERLAQLRLASWAGSLRRSLANEQRRYEALAVADRRSWLRAQMGELGAGSGQPGGGELVRAREKASGRAARLAALDLADPLGLARWGERGWLVLHAGGVGVLGALAAWTLGRWLAEGLAQAWAAEDGGWFGMLRREIGEVMVCE